MNKNEFSRLKEGQSVMYFGENDYENGIMRGDIFKVTEKGRSAFILTVRSGRRMLVHENGPGHIKGTAKTAETYRIVADLPTCRDDKTDLMAVDYELLIDYAIGMKDFEWAKELYAAKQSIGI